MAEFASVSDALDALVQNRADFDTVAEWLCSLPLVEQAPPAPYWADVWVGNDGPVSRVQLAFFMHQGITAAQTVELLKRMREAGHQA